MKLEDQVVSLESAKKLKELKITQDSLWYWVERQADKHKLLWFHRELFNSTGEKEAILSETHPCRNYSAPTVAELGELLPHKLDDDWRLWSWFTGDFWIIYYECFYDTSNEKNARHEKGGCHGKTEAEARAKMLIYLLENKLMERK